MALDDTPTEFKVFVALLRNRTGVISNSQLAVHGWHCDVDDHLVEVHISSLAGG